MLRKIVFLATTVFNLAVQAANLPEGFVYLKDIDPTILQDIRYASAHNFIGRPIKGYQSGTCILTKNAALALHEIQNELRKHNFSLKIYDCYRPQMAVNDFVKWSQDPAAQQMKQEFYLNVNKADVFKLGYIADKSGHTRGSTVDLTLVSLPIKQQASYHQGQKLVPCFYPYKLRYQDNSVDMGTGFDCFDSSAHINYQELNKVALQNRQLLQKVMQQHHFVVYPNEWWHFTLEKEPYPNTYFNFRVS